MSFPLILTLVFLTFTLLQSSFHVTSQATPLFSPVTKDQTTKLYTMLIYMKTPLQPSQLHLDLGSYLPWYDCDRQYNSSSYQPVVHDSSLCLELNTGVWVSCDDRPGPGCLNDTCGFIPVNPVTQKSIVGNVITDTFTLPTTKSPAQLGPISRLVFSCTFLDKNATVYRGLAKGSAGLASLGRFNYSLSGQISRDYSSPWIFALCLPSSPKSPGVVLFNSAGPYNFSPKIDASKLLAYTGLIPGPDGPDWDDIYTRKSPDYYIGLTSIRVNDRVLSLNRTLLAIHQNGNGGTKISTSNPYSVLQTSIYKSLIDAFVKESAKLNLTLVKPVKRFSVCFAADKVPTGRAGPVVPTIDLVFESSKNFWRIYGSNSMVRIKSNSRLDVWCLGFVDGGLNPKASIVIGGHQIEDNLLQFDLEKQRLGFSSSLLLKSTTCANFDFKSK